MRIIDTPGKAPYAASAVILHNTGLILTVSRKHDPDDLGLPGGKLERDQNFLDACVAEVAQETGLEVTQAEPFFGDYCGTEGVHVVHWNLTFLCRVQGHIHTEEKGRVVWVKPNRLIGDPQRWMKPNSFSDYNTKMLIRLEDIRKTEGLGRWHNFILLDPAHVDDRW